MPVPSRELASLYLRASFEALDGDAPTGRVARLVGDAAAAFDRMDDATMAAKAQQVWILATGGDPNNVGGTSSVVVSVDEKAAEYRLVGAPPAASPVAVSVGAPIQAWSRDD